MTKINKWGPSTWDFMHLIAHSIDDNSTVGEINVVYTFIYRICLTLPCPDCVSHAKIFLQEVRFNSLNTAEKLRQFLYMFHNAVNKRLGKRMISYIEVCEKYKNITYNRFFETTNIFYNHFHTRGNFVLMSENYARTLLKRDLQAWIRQSLIATGDGTCILFCKQNNNERIN